MLVCCGIMYHTVVVEVRRRKIAVGDSNDGWDEQSFSSVALTQNWFCCFYCDKVLNTQLQKRLLLLMGCSFVTTSLVICHHIMLLDCWNGIMWQGGPLLSSMHVNIAMNDASWCFIVYCKKSQMSFYLVLLTEYREQNNLIVLMNDMTREA
jgi:hypothetical protein